MALRLVDGDGDGYLDGVAERAAPDPAAPRSEVVAAADALWALFEAGVLDQKPEVIARVARHSGVPVPELREARDRWLRGWAILPRSSLAAGVGALVGRKTVAGPARHHTSSRFTPRQGHEEAAKVCRGCSQELPIEEYLATWRLSRADRTVRYITRASRCHDCRLAKSRARYLDVDKARVLEMALADTDGLVGQGCPECRHPFQAGEEVTGHLEVVRHVACPPAGEA